MGMLKTGLSQLSFVNNVVFQFLIGILGIMFMATNLLEFQSLIGTLKSTVLPVLHLTSPGFNSS